MNTLSRTITGIVTIIVGIGLVLIPLFVPLKKSFVSLIYGIPLFIIGFFILLNRNEDKIEEIVKSKDFLYCKILQPSFHHKCRYHIILKFSSSRRG